MYGFILFIYIDLLNIFFFIFFLEDEEDVNVYKKYCYLCVLVWKKINKIKCIWMCVEISIFFLLVRRYNVMKVIIFLKFDCII